MGRWSRHPMGSDGALDAECYFFKEFEEGFESSDEYYFDRDESEIREYLESLSLDDLKRICSNQYIQDDRFVVPYIYQKYGASVKDEVRDYLIESFDYTDDITGEYNYCSERDENGEVLELKHIRFFKENFDAIMNNEIELSGDPGLLAAIFEATDGLINKL